MAVGLKPNKQAMKIAYAILKTPKDQRQQNNPKPSEKREAEWFRDSSQSQ